MTCSVIWDDTGLPAWGTAPRAAFWVAVEQAGPWGAKAFTQSRLDPAIGAAIEAAALAAGGRALLIRRPIARGEQADRSARQVYLAGGLAGRPWLLAGQVSEPAEVLSLPWGELAGPDAVEVLRRVDWLAPLAEGVLLVCGNSKRDLCCAQRGRPIALELEREHPGRVWECTHTGGHRFAPTGVVLPSGQSLARLTVEVARAALDAADAGRLAPATFGPWHDRGRGHLTPVCAVAEAHVRELTGETDPAALAAVDSGDSTVEVRHSDGRVWTLRLALQDCPEQLAESCGKAAVTARSWSVLAVS
ncbi:MAG: sucrase ferredoxin [Micropruina sp.]|uniref:sucrase ferredoxin n=1 Tax=Micropruina sp. TaxID=2737536 RepID=UPI0039E3ABD3